ncbi:MAG: hypothetical protein RH917_08375 [Lacipirellulaceae bacterium]
MSSSSLRITASVCLLANLLCGPFDAVPARAEDGSDPQANQFEAALEDASWEQLALKVATDALEEAPTQRDESVEPAQGLAPSLGIALGTLPLQQQLRANPRRRNQQRPGVALGLASTPFMIGDTSAGTCFSQRGIIFQDFGHPTLTCSRLNVSENNTAIPVDRIYYSYRHFHNATQLQLFQFQQQLNYDRHTIGMERTFAGGMGSVEVRLPIERRLRSDVISIIDPAGSGVVDLIADNDYETDIGNVSFISKIALYETNNFLLTGGLGVTVPTARDVNYAFAVNTGVDLSPLFPGLTSNSLGTFVYEYTNETTYLSPFAAWLFTPDSPKARWFHQGFLQIEVAANPSTLAAQGSITNNFFVNGLGAGGNIVQTPGAQQVLVDVFAQTLMRLNLGLGYQVTDDTGGLISNVRALAELHYTTTLQEANTSDVPLEVPAAAGVGLAPGLQVSSVGNPDPRTDILNAALGVSADVGRFVITHGFIAPLKSAPDRGFDFEYNCQVQLPF